MARQTDRIEIVNGERRVVFVRGDKGWAPDWFYLGERRMLRFKDHEWLSLGHVRPTFAESAKRSRGGAVFSGSVPYGKTVVAWTVRVAPDTASGGFAVETLFRPERTIELMEMFSSFETPYEYDGGEHATTVIGENPITQWKGKERVSPLQWAHPFWSYNRAESVHMTGPCNAPFVCQRVSNPDGTNPRCTTIVGDWTVCRAKHVYVTPTRTVEAKPAEGGEQKDPGRRGYKFIVGAINWSSSMEKDPNVMCPGGTAQRQRLFLTFSAEAPDGFMDKALIAAWERAAACDLPADGRVPAYDGAVARGVTWQAAMAWMRGVFCGAGAEGFFLPDRGFTAYADGTRPRAGGYSWDWWPQWSGLLHYRALLAGDAELAAKCEEYDARFQEAAAKRYGMMMQPIIGITAVPSLWWIRGAGKNSTLAAALRGGVEASWKQSVAENGTTRQGDYGSQAVRAEGLLLAADAYGETRYADQALLLLAEVNAQLDGAFWTFGCTNWSDTSHGGQVRPMGYGHAVSANRLAWQRTGRAEYLTAARRFARLLVAVNYVTHNASPVPDYDWRGWANGTTGGRDQHAQFPPWETSNALLGMSTLMAEQELEAGCYDVLWYFARTGLAQFPAARTLKRVWSTDMQVRHVPRGKIASEADFYDILPYLAYENPYDQTLLASYQGSDCVIGEFVFGGGLARAADDRLLVLAPRAACLDPAEVDERLLCVWNPLAEPIVTDVTVTWPDGKTTTRPVTALPRSVLRLTVPRKG